MKTKTIPLSEIRLDSGTQCRGELNQDTVAEYAERMACGDVFPPCDVFFDGSEHHMADGFHRYMASHRNKVESIECNIHTGTAQDALWFGLGSNRRNGLRLNNSDKRRAVELALAKFPDKSQQEIADHVGCTQGYVAKVKSDVIPRNNTAVTRKDSTGRSQPTRKPRKTSEPAKPAKPEQPENQQPTNSDNEPPRVQCGISAANMNDDESRSHRITRAVMKACEELEAVLAGMNATPRELIQAAESLLGRAKRLEFNAAKLAEDAS